MLGPGTGATGRYGVLGGLPIRRVGRSISGRVSAHTRRRAATGSFGESGWRCEPRGSRLQVHHRRVQPVEPVVRLVEAHHHVPPGAHHVRRRADDVANHRPDAVAPCALRQGRVLHRPKQDLGDLPQDVEGWVGPVAGRLGPARRMMQVHVAQRPLVGVLLALLAPVAMHQFLQSQVVARHHDHRVVRHQQKLVALAAAADHHVVLLPFPAAWAMGGEVRLLFHADIRPSRVGQSIKLLQHRLAPPVMRHADRVIPATGSALPGRRPAAVARPTKGRPGRWRAASSRGCRCSLPRPLKESPVHLDAGGVDEQRNVALCVHLVVDDGRRDTGGKLNDRAVCWPPSRRAAHRGR